MAGQITMRNLGAEKCTETLPNGRRCHNLEIEGMEYCLRHMPEDLLKEAEEVCGARRCRQGEDGQHTCRDYAEPGSKPPACEHHRASKRAHRAIRQVQNEADEIVAEIMLEGGEKLINAAPVDDPLGELMLLAGKMREWMTITEQLVMGLKRSQMRYPGKAGEQIRAEIIIHERAMDRYGTILNMIAKLDIDERLLGIRKQTAAMLEMALQTALEKADVPLDKQPAARETFRKNLKIVA